MALAHRVIRGNEHRPRQLFSQPVVTERREVGDGRRVHQLHGDGELVQLRGPGGAGRQGDYGEPSAGHAGQPPLVLQPFQDLGGERPLPRLEGQSGVADGEGGKLAHPAQETRLDTAEGPPAL